MKIFLLKHIKNMLVVRIIIYDIIINRIFKKKESKIFFLFFYKNIYGITLVSRSHSSFK